MGMLDDLFGDVSKRQRCSEGMFRDEVTVQFDTGATEVVRPSDLRRHSWY